MAGPASGSAYRTQTHHVRVSQCAARWRHALRPQLSSRKETLQWQTWKPHAARLQTRRLHQGRHLVLCPVGTDRSQELLYQMMPTACQLKRQHLDLCVQLQR